MRTKLISFVAVIGLLSATTAFALSDIAGHKNQTAIQYLYENKVISGYEDGSFKPDQPLNRAELLKILVGGKGVVPTVEQYNNCFPDVKDEWFAPFVCYAKQEGWVEGYPDNTFRPGNKVNRVEAIKMLVNSQGFEVPGVVSEVLFADTDSGSWYAPFLKAAKDKGILEEASGDFRPSDNMLRGSISENIYRAMTLGVDGVTYYKVLKVVDGDTVAVEINGVSETLRLIGIDTPETVHPSKPVQCYGTEASNKAKEVLTGQEVALEADETQSDRDKYDRLLRYVILKDGTNFNKFMIEQGFANEYTYDSNPYKYQAEFKAAEAYAMENKLGLWSPDTCNGDTEQTVEPVETPVEEPVDTNFTSSQCSANTYNCSDFSSQAEAQALFDYCMAEVGIDIHKLDQDNNGDACEAL